MSSTELTDADLQSILEFTSTLARKAGDLILEGSEVIAASGDVNEKKNSVDLVTEYDVKVEELVMEEIKKAYPNFQFIGEESYSAGTRPDLTDDPTFCVDPIDGTTNFVHGFPFVAISLGLIYKKRPVLGVVYNPFLDYLYTGLKGHGSYLSKNKRPPQKLPLSTPRPLPSLSQAVIAVEWGSDRSQVAAGSKADSFLRLAGDPNHATSPVKGGKMAHSLRSLGSAALNFSMVAQGGLDMYWEIGCWAWDVCAGIVIGQEAGCYFIGGHDSPRDGEVTPEILLGRKYLIVRAIADSGDEKGIDVQKRIAEEFYATVADTDPN